MIIAPDFFEHWKTKALIELTKRPESPLWVQRLWAHCQTRKAWEFRDLSALALKSICGVPAEITPDAWKTMLLDSRFVRESGKKLIVHDWDEHNAQLIARWSGGGATAAKHKAGSGKAAAKLRAGDREDRLDRDDRKEGTERDALILSIYLAYPRHIGPKAAKKAIAKALEATPGEQLLAKTQQYARAVADLPKSERQFLPHPASWFNAGRYEDDPAEWQRAEKNREGHGVPGDMTKPHAHTGGLEVFESEAPPAPEGAP